MEYLMLSMKPPSMRKGIIKGGPIERAIDTLLLAQETRYPERNMLSGVINSGKKHGKKVGENSSLPKLMAAFVIRVTTPQAIRNLISSGFRPME